jgi:hypothetical protein
MLLGKRPLMPTMIRARSRDLRLKRAHPHAKLGGKGKK